MVKIAILTTANQWLCQYSPDISKSLDDQFNLLRTVDNNEYPAFFEINGRRYVIKIEEIKN